MDANAPVSAALDHSSRSLVARLVRDYLRPQAPRIGAALVLMLITAATTVAFAKLIEPILDSVFDSSAAGLIWPVAAAVFVVGTLGGVSNYGQRVLMAKTTLAVTRDVQKALFAHIARADMAFFQRVSTGRLVSRAINDVVAMRTAFADSFVSLGRDVVTLAGLVGLMVYQDWRLSAAALIALPIAFYVIFAIGMRSRRLSRQYFGQQAEATTLLDEVFRGIRAIKAYSAEDRETERAKASFGDLYKISVKLEKTRALGYPFLESLAALAVACIVVYGGYQVLNGTKTAGALMSFIVALGLSFMPLKRLTQLNAKLQAGLAAAQRVFEILDLEPAIVNSPNARPLEIGHGEIRFENVRFVYETGGFELSGISLEIPAGSTVALVGPSGSGKSTILNLIPRFYDVVGGKVTIDGQDIRAVTLESLRQSIALVSQETILFDDTVAANILCGRPDASHDEMVAAAQHAGAHEFISALPDGYETPVGGRGERLSGGQRQRIAIARAMLKDAPILLLDEATSSLDTQSERQIQYALAELMTGRTTLIVAHRLSTIAKADLIYVIDQGHIAEFGNHSELLAKGGLYTTLSALQGGKDDSPPVAADRVARA